MFAVELLTCRNIIHSNLVMLSSTW